MVDWIFDQDLRRIDQNSWSISIRILIELASKSDILVDWNMGIIDQNSWSISIRILIELGGFLPFWSNEISIWILFCVDQDSDRS